MIDKIYKVYKSANLRNRQRKVNKEFEKNGLTDDILEEQIAINSERHELDISDDTKTVHENFVQ